MEPISFARKQSAPRPWKAILAIAFAVAAALTAFLLVLQIHAPSGSRAELPTVTSEPAISMTATPGIAPSVD